jgi:hypothetical protein
MNLHSADYILTDLAAILLLRRGFAPLHCSAFRKGEATVVVIAPPNAGKTLSAMTACLKHDASYLAEDLALTDGETIYSVPWTSTFRYYSQIDQSLSANALSALTRIVPLVELLPLRKPKPITGFLNGTKILTKSRTTHLVVLERGTPVVRTLSTEEAYRKASNLNRYEFNYRKSPLIIAYEFFNQALDVEAAFLTEQEILRRMVQNANSRLLVRAERPSDYASIILDNIS